MARAHLSKRLSDSDAIKLFAEHHIVQVRRRKNGEIVKVKHAALGWMDPEQYYGLQKVHDLMPLIQEFVHGGYRAKQTLWGLNIEIAGFPVPLGGSLPLLESVNFFSELFRQPINPQMLALRAYALFGPWGDVIQLVDIVLAAVGYAEGFVGWFSQQPGATNFIGPIPIPPNPYQPPGTEPTVE